MKIKLKVTYKPGLPKTVKVFDCDWYSHGKFHLFLHKDGQTEPIRCIASADVEDWEEVEDEIEPELNPKLSVIEQYLQDNDGNLTEFYRYRATGSSLADSFRYTLSQMDLYILRQTDQYDRVVNAQHKVNEPFLNGITKFLKAERAKMSSNHPLWKIK